MTHDWTWSSFLESYSASMILPMYLQDCNASPMLLTAAVTLAVSAACEYK